MITLFLAYGFGLPTVFVLVNLILFRVYTTLNFQWAEELKRMTAEWQDFMKRGIPIPSDYIRIEHRFEGEPVLIRPEFQVKKTERAA
ncbi:MAG: hypothetical protein ACE5HN_06320 [Nitrospiria bacterium]